MMLITVYVLYLLLSLILLWPKVIVITFMYLGKINRMCNVIKLNLSMFQVNLVEKLTTLHLILK